MSEASLLAPRSGGTDFGFAAGTLATLAFLVLGFLSILWTPYAIAAFDPGSALQDASGAHWLGTDPLGRDLLSLLMTAILTSFVVAGIGISGGAILGIPLGLLAVRWPRFGGGVSAGTAGLLTLLPPLIVAIVLATDFGASAVVSMAAIGIGAIAPLAVVTRHSVEAAASRTYLDASRLAGLGRWEAVRHHAMRQIIRPIAAEAIVLLAIGVTWEAALGYLGLGSQPPAASLGLILRDAQSYIAAKPLLVVIPGLTLTLMILALRAVARGVRRETEAEESLGPA